MILNDEAYESECKLNESCFVVASPDWPTHILVESFYSGNL
jgi:hypothetical protein